MFPSAPKVVVPSPFPNPVVLQKYATEPDSCWCRSELWLLRHKHSSQCPDAGTNPFRSSLHKLKSGAKLVTPPFISASDMMKMVIGAPESRLRQTTKRNVAEKGSATQELQELLMEAPDTQSGEEVQLGAALTREQLATLAADESREEREDREAAERAEREEQEQAKQRALARAQGHWTLMSGKRFDCPVVSVGACMKTSKRGAGAKYLQEQLQFLDWAYSRGVAHKGAKMTAREAEVAMTLMGTQMGHQQFGCAAASGCSCPTVLGGRDREQCIWQPRPDGACKFRAPALLEHWSFRTWFSGQKAAFKSKLEKCVDKNRETTLDQMWSAGGDDDDDIAEGDD